MPTLCITDYKRAVAVISGSVILFQIIRIIAISVEISPLCHYYPQPHSIAFCILSIFLGILSIALEAILLWDLKERKIGGIQPWFLCTFIIFLVASLSVAVTASLYIIRPFDHNIKVQDKLDMNGTLKNFQTEEIDHHRNKTSSSDPLEDLTNKVQKVLQGFVHHDENEKMKSNESVALVAKLNDTVIFSELVPPVYIKNKCSKKGLLPEMVFYSVRPALTLSFLLDVIRSFPQLFLVNRYVKSERLHHMHYHSHASLATLYIKQADK